MSILNAMTLQLYQELSQAEWFVNVGTPMSEEGVLVVADWSVAEGICLSETWENVQLEAGNLMTEKLFAINRSRYNLWNDILASVKDRFEPLIDSKTQGLNYVIQDVESVYADIRWNVVSAAMECEYSNVYNSDFFRNIVKWYELGRFPCGWDGAFPQGRLIIY